LTSEEEASGSFSYEYVGENSVDEEEEDPSRSWSSSVAGRTAGHKVKLFFSDRKFLTEIKYSLKFYLQKGKLRGITVLLSPSPVGTPGDPDGDPVNIFESQSWNTMVRGDSFLDVAFPKKLALALYFAPSGTPPKFVRVEEALPEMNCFFASPERHPSCVLQGTLADLWFLSSVAALSLNRELLDAVVPVSNDAVDNGMYRFRFYKFGRWREVIVDTMLATNSAGRLLEFARSGAVEESWVSLLEKAYAKFHGCYSALQGGNPLHGLLDLTGGHPDTVWLGAVAYDAEEARDELWVRLKGLLPNLAVVLAGTRARSTPLDASFGILGGGRSYPLLECLETDDGVRLCRVGNPWGRGKWAKAFGPADDEWRSRPELTSKIKLAPHGLEFLCRWDDLCERFTRLDISHLERGWRCVSHYGIWSKESGTCKEAPEFALVVEGRGAAATPVHLHLERTDPRQLGGARTKPKASWGSLPQASISVYRAGELLARFHGDSYSVASGCLGQLELNRGSYTVRVHQKDSLEGHYVVSCSLPAERKFTFEPADLDPEVFEVVPRNCAPDGRKTESSEHYKLCLVDESMEAPHAASLVVGGGTVGGGGGGGGAAASTEAYGDFEPGDGPGELDLEEEEPVDEEDLALLLKPIQVAAATPAGKAGQPSVDSAKMRGRYRRDAGDEEGAKKQKKCACQVS
jgi:hypothetical protein